MSAQKEVLLYLTRLLQSRDAQYPHKGYDAEPVSEDDGITWEMIRALLTPPTTETTR